MLSLVLWALQAVLVSGHAQARRQASPADATATFNITSSTTTSLRSTAPATTSEPSTAPPCCYFAGWVVERVIGVRGNFWYTETAVQTVATVVSTILDYGDREEVANVSTNYVPEDALYTRFGQYGIRTVVFGDEVLSVNSELEALGIPSTLINGLDYAATVVYKADQSSAYGVAYPTPFLVWDSVQVLYDLSTSCPPAATGNPAAYDIDAYREIDISRDVEGAYLTDTAASATYFYVQKLPVDAPQPSMGVYPLPSGAIDRFISIQTSAYPWITDCTPADTPGEPTVHIAVNQLTDTSRVTITMPRLGSSDPSPGPTADAAEITVAPTPPSTSQDAEALQIAPNTAPTPDNGPASEPLQTPDDTEDQSPSSASNPIPDTVPPQNQTPDDEKSSTAPENASPETLPSSASPSSESPNSDQDDQNSPEASGDAPPVLPESTPDSDTAKNEAPEDEAVSESSDATGPDESVPSEAESHTATNDGFDIVSNGDTASASGAPSASAGIGDAIMSGLGQSGSASNDASSTGPAYTGAAAPRMRNLVLFAFSGLIWLARRCA
ncbi:hypothetical protein BST61_g7910 [Cercospora zeina]